MFRYAPGVCKSSGEDHAKLVRALDITLNRSAIEQPQCDIDRNSILVRRGGAYDRNLNDTRLDVAGRHKAGTNANFCLLLADGISLITRILSKTRPKPWLR